jgi:hypothetical protein
MNRLFTIRICSQHSCQSGRQRWAYRKGFTYLTNAAGTSVSIAFNVRDSAASVWERSMIACEENLMQRGGVYVAKGSLLFESTKVLAELVLLAGNQRIRGTENRDPPRRGSARLHVSLYGEHVMYSHLVRGQMFRMAWDRRPCVEESYSLGVAALLARLLGVMALVVMTAGEEGG